MVSARTHLSQAKMIISVLLLCCASASQASIDMGGLTPYLQNGQYGAWSVQAEGDSVVLANQRTAGDITYYYQGSDPEDQGSRTIDVAVQLLNTTDYSWAGLLYGYQENPKSYYIFALQPNNQVSLVERTASGFEVRLSQSFRGKSRNINQLSIQENGNSIDLLVNGKSIGNYGNNSIGRGAVGIAAGDIGSYRFRGFKVSSTSAATSKPAANAKPAITNNLAKATSRPQGSANNKSQLRFEETYDPKFNMVSMRMPIPPGWEQQDPSKQTKGSDEEGVLFKAPGGISIFQPRGRLSYFLSGNPTLDGFARQTGAVVEPYQPLAPLMKSILLSAMQAEGARIINEYKVPELLNFHRQEITDDPWYTNQFDSWGADWQLANGERLATLSVQILSTPTARSMNRGNGLRQSLIMTRALEGPEKNFEKTKQDLIASIANIEINAVWKERQYRQHVQKMAQIEANGDAAMLASQRRHNERMASQNAQRRLSQTYSEISDITHSGYMSRSNIQYEGHKSSVGGIWERTNIYGSDGSSFSVPAGSNHYWVNKNTGQYLATDNALFNPAQQGNFSGQWEQFQQR